MKDDDVKPAVLQTVQQTPDLTAATKPADTRFWYGYGDICSVASNGLIWQPRYILAVSGHWCESAGLGRALDRAWVSGARSLVIGPVPPLRTLHPHNSWVWSLELSALTILCHRVTLVNEQVTGYLTPPPPNFSLSFAVPYFSSNYFWREQRKSYPKSSANTLNWKWSFLSSQATINLQF